MNIHEHQAKELLRQYGIPTPDGIAAYSVREAGEATQQLPGPLYVVKAQIHAGGRGKGRFKEAAAGEKEIGDAAERPVARHSELRGKRHALSIRWIAPRGKTAWTAVPSARPAPAAGTLATKGPNEVCSSTRRMAP